MSDKPIAGVVAVVAVAPLCAICILGPAVLGSAVTSVAGWLGGLDLVVATATAGGSAALVYGVLWWSRLGREIRNRKRGHKMQRQMVD